MNLNNLNGKKKVGILFAVLLMVVGLVVTIFLVQRSQENRSHAEKATTISLDPPTRNIAPGKSADLELRLNPGMNQISTVKFTIKFDPAVFDPANVNFVINPDSSLKVIEGPIKSSTGTIAYSLGPKDVTKVINTISSLGTLTFLSSSDAKTGDYKIDFDEANTDARSIGSGESAGDNVLQTPIGAVISINAQCVPDQGTCSWDAVEGATKYQFVITDQAGKKTTGETADTSTTFQIAPGGTYTCNVKALNDCGGVGEAGEGVSTCATPSGTVTPTPSVPGSTATPTPKVTSTVTPTTPKSSVTPTPTVPGVTSTPTPTTEIGSSPTPSIPVTEISNTPTLPPTGSPLVIGGIVGGILILLGGLALLIL